MFEDVRPEPADPLLGIMVAFGQDTNPRKVDLGVGEYKQEDGLTPIFASVKAAEAQLINNQNSKSYVGPSGSLLFNQLMTDLMFGKDHRANREQRIGRSQTPGGSGALRVGMELIKRGNPNARVWVSDPTWSNHEPIIRATGLQLGTYPYYDHQRNGINFDAMMDALSAAVAGDIVLLHACCHNPSGADLTQEQWRNVCSLAGERGLIPFIDVAYQGFGDDLDTDAFSVRLCADELPELIVASSCSKNFGLYRERTGALCVVTQTNEQAAAINTHINQISRGMYSMPPAHGASIVETLLSDARLTKNWRAELDAVRSRMLELRQKIAQGLATKLSSSRFDFIEQQKGMFSFLSITPEQIQRLREDYSIYMAGSSRINIAGLNDNNIDYVVDAIAAVLADS